MILRIDRYEDFPKINEKREESENKIFLKSIKKSRNMLL